MIYSSQVKNLTNNSTDEIIERLSKNMKGYETFFEHKENLIVIIPTGDYPAASRGGID